jgi:hypothetical protein
MLALMGRTPAFPGLIPLDFDHQVALWEAFFPGLEQLAVVALWNDLTLMVDFDFLCLSKIVFRHPLRVA